MNKYTFLNINRGQRRLKNKEHKISIENNYLKSNKENQINKNSLNVNIAQRKSIRSLFRLKYSQDKIQLAFLFLGIFGLNIVSWGLAWIIGVTCCKPKSHRGKKIRQINGTLTLLILATGPLFGFYFYYYIKDMQTTDTTNIGKKNIESLLVKNETIIQAPNPQILACSSHIDVEIVLWQQSKEIEKGLVIFIGKLTADSWRSSRILKIAYKNEFSVIAISPPGIGKTTQLTPDIIQNSDVSSSSFLYWIIVTCFQKKTTETVIVSQSNSITQLYTIPLIMTYPVAGIIFFNTNMGIKWFTALNPVISDHYYYQPVNFDNTIVRYIGDKRSPIISASNSTQNGASNSSKLNISPNKTIKSTVISNYTSSNNINGLNSNSHRALQIIQSNEVNYVKGMSNVTKAIFSCVAPNVSYKFNVDWYLTEQDKLGPFGWFDGKYTIPGWQMVQTVYEATDFDVFEGTRVKNGSYVLNVSYFKPLAIALSQVLPIIAQIIAFPSNTSNSQTLQNNSTNSSNFTGSDNIAPTTFNDIRQKEYMRYRTKFELIPAQNVYCTT